MKKLTKAIAAIMLVLASFVMLTNCNKLSSEKKILSFKFYEPAVEATIMESAKTVIATVPEGTNVTALVPVITVSDNATINPASGVPQNFTNPKTYTVTAEDGTQAVYTVTVTLGSGGGNGGEEPLNYTISVSANPTVGGTVTGGGTFQEGQSCTVTATANDNYLFDNWTENSIVVSSVEEYTFTITSNRALVANFTYHGAPDGAVNGKFSVNANEDMVYFSQGNLQYQASTNTWQFATNQYDYLGSSNSSISSSYSGWIDLFGWGTSGYNHGAVCYQPWNTNDNNENYYAYGQYSYDLDDQTGQADWGYNAISNGGNTENSGWHTLTVQEWNYVFSTRATSSGIRFIHGNVNGVNGVILLPDSWVASIYPLSQSYYFYSNSITADDWENILEANGAVFLPASGHRSPNGVFEAGSIASYWTTSQHSTETAYCPEFTDGHVYIYNSAHSRYVGRSVRLVRPVQ